MTLLIILLAILGLVILCFAALGVYIFIQVVKIAMIQVKMKETVQQSPEEMKEVLLRFAERHNKKE